MGEYILCIGIRAGVRRRLYIHELNSLVDEVNENKLTVNVSEGVADTSTGVIS